MTTHSHAQPDDHVIERVRALFLQSVSEEAAIERGQQLLASVPGDEDPRLEAYGAMFSIMRAKHVFWPGRKMHYLNEGLPVLDRLVEAHPDHVEIRYLRLMGCYYLPRILGRGWSVDEDFRQLARLLPGAREAFPEKMYGEMVTFVRENGDLAGAERERLARALDKEASIPHQARPPQPAGRNARIGGVEGDM